MTFIGCILALIKPWDLLNGTTIPLLNGITMAELNWENAVLAGNTHLAENPVSH